MLQFIGVTILVVLGCHISNIQNDRLVTAVSFQQEINTFHVNGTQTEPIWFLTGGVKSALTSLVGQIQVSEAETMSNMVNTFSDNIVLDTKARNTAENFVNLKNWISANVDGIDFDKINIVITTSKFHQKRAEKIFKGVFHDTEINPYWNLSAESCSHCESDEHIHIRNVDADVKRALETL
jgi:uncharacterized SAM-binding protein YcdF (DUF218 family)